MTFTVQDYSDLVRLLAEHPEWQADLRRLLLADDFLALPHLVRDLAVAQQRTEQRLEALATAQHRTEQRVEELAAAQHRTEQRLEELAAAQQRTEQRLEELADLVRRVELQLVNLTETQQRVQDRLGRLEGRMLEMDYREKAPAYFGRLVRRVRLVSRETFQDELEAQLTDEELYDLLLADVLVGGQLGRGPQADPIWLVVEVSAKIDEYDVIRARRRADLLRKAGYPAVPVAAGEDVTPEVTNEARLQRVALLQDGRIWLWDEALAA
jgi:hypothetical protein